MNASAAPCEGDTVSIRLSVTRCEESGELVMVATADRQAVLAVMPETARELVEAIGFDDALQFLRKHGGKRVFIPGSLPEDGGHWLIADFGHDLAARLVRYFDGAHLEVPMLSSVERLLRDNAIRSDFDAMCRAGERDPMKALVERYRMTQRYLRKLLKASPSTSPRMRPQHGHDKFTLDLFSHLDAGKGAAA